MQNGCIIANKLFDVSFSSEAANKFSECDTNNRAFRVDDEVNKKAF